MNPQNDIYIMVISEAKTGVNARTRTWRALNTTGLGFYLVSNGELLKFWRVSDRSMLYKTLTRVRTGWKGKLRKWFIRKLL